MEDRHSIIHLRLRATSNVTIASVFDGHGGALCSDYVNRTLPNQVGKYMISALSERILNENIQSDMVNLFREVDVQFRQFERARGSQKNSGTTAMVAAFWRNKQAKICMVLAHVGDCRAVLCRHRDGVDHAIQLSNEHTAESTAEQERIRTCGGRIIRTVDGRNRVEGQIQVTRSLGDDKLKCFGVCADPEVLVYEFDNSTDEFIIMATDGVFDTLSNEDAVKAVRDTAKDPGLSAKRVCSEALANGTSDNLSCIVVYLKEFNSVDRIF